MKMKKDRKYMGWPLIRVQQMLNLKYKLMFISIIYTKNNVCP